MRYGSTEGTREHVGTRSRKIARKASARLNVLLRGCPNYSCNMPAYKRPRKSEITALCQTLNFRLRIELQQPYCISPLSSLLCREKYGGGGGATAYALSVLLLHHRRDLPVPGYRALSVPQTRPGRDG